LSWVVGVDVGASHIEAALAPDSTSPPKRVRTAGTVVKPGHVNQVAKTISSTIDRLNQEIKPSGQPSSIVVGAAGTHTEDLRSALEQSLGKIFPGTLVHVTTDGEVALEAAFGSRSGIVVCAGTGSIAYARTGGSEIRRVGGLGPELADEGSGYAIGRAGLRAAARAADGRLPLTSLASAIPDAVGVENLDDLIDWAWEADRPAIAALAQSVSQEADSGDEVAQTIIQTAAADLGELVVSLAKFFDVAGGVAVAFSGGVLSLGSPVRSALVNYLAETFPSASVHENTVDPVLGALAIASRISKA